MRERSAALEGFKNGEIRFLICTDVAARGIDIKELPYVISTTLPPSHSVCGACVCGVCVRAVELSELCVASTDVTLPDKSEDYIHRVGRVGRADRLGMAISIVARGKEKVWFHQCKSRGSGCQDVRLVEEGGCGLWFDEPTYFAAIQKRLGGEPIPEVLSTTTSPLDGE
jgi:ATP-dependent RNA helicase DDX1